MVDSNGDIVVDKKNMVNGKRNMVCSDIVDGKMDMVDGNGDIVWATGKVESGDIGCQEHARCNVVCSDEGNARNETSNREQDVRINKWVSKFEYKN